MTPEHAFDFLKFSGMILHATRAHHERTTEKTPEGEYLVCFCSPNCPIILDVYMRFEPPVRTNAEWFSEMMTTLWDHTAMISYAENGMMIECAEGTYRVFTDGSEWRYPDGQAPHPRNAMD